MASKKFAHWNGFPFMTAPRTNYYSAQLQSPLFRLPREVRDAIYAYYSLGQDGYHYDSETGKMLYTVEPRQAVQLGLMITCRIAHEELKHIVFRKLQFKTHHSYDEGLSYMGVRSRAGRFKCMLRLVERQKRRMLIKVFELLQPDDLHELYTRFPTVKRWFDIPLRQSVVEQVDKLEATEGFSGDEEDHELSESAFAHALQYALVCAKDRNRADFVRLTRGLFGVGQCPIDRATNYTQSNIFEEGALYDVYSWNPEPWSLPDDAEMAKLEALLCVPDDTDTQLPINDEGTFYFPDLNTHMKAAKERWFFSAASIAIDFLRQMSPERRHNMRTIVLNEDFKAVSRSECHAEGLIPFCRENPELRVERRISLVANVFPEEFQCPVAREPMFQWLFVQDCFRLLIPWIEEALSLPSRGMPPRSFTLVIDGSTQETSEMWRLLLYAAATQEARLEQCRLNGTDLHPRPLLRYYQDFWSLPSNFAEMIRDIVAGTSVVKYEGEVREPWDQDVFTFERRDWAEEQWYNDWEINVLRQRIPSKFYVDGALRYHITPSAIRTTRQILRHGATRSNETQPSV